MSVIDARGLTKTFGSGASAVAAVTGANISVDAGEIVLLLGPSGSGKTTLVSMLGGLLTPTTGTVEIEGVGFLHQRSDAAGLRLRTIGFVFQSFNLLGVAHRSGERRSPAASARGGQSRGDRNSEHAAQFCRIGRAAQRVPRYPQRRREATGEPCPRARGRATCSACRRANREPGHQQGARGDGVAAQVGARRWPSVRRGNSRYAPA